MKRTQLVVLSAVGTLITISGCAKREVPASDTTVAATSTAATATPATRNFGAKQPYQLQAEDDASITVDVQVYDNAIIVNKASPPSQDALIGKILNTSTKKEKRYKFKPQDLAEYYLYASHTGGWFINEEKKNGKETLYATGSFGSCDPMHPVTGANLGFKYCPLMKSAAKKASIKKSSMISGGFFGGLFARVAAYLQHDSAGNVPADGNDNPGWVACTDGCCTLGNPSFAQ